MAAELYEGENGCEAVGIRLMNAVGALMREVVGDVKPIPAPIGPDFDYQSSSPLFWGRSGRGPLHVVWDTNLLIDYLQHGRALWLHADWSVGPSRYAEELDALQLVMGLWVLRDIRMHIPHRVLDDAKRKLSDRRLTERARAARRFADAISLVGYGGPDWPGPGRRGIPLWPDSYLSEALSGISGDFDRALVADAVSLGAHMFLTRDEQVIAAGRALRRFGLFVGTPEDLLEELVACGAFHCLLEPSYAYWPLPDLARVTQLLRALPPGTAAAV